MYGHGVKFGTLICLAVLCTAASPVPSRKAIGSTAASPGASEEPSGASPDSSSSARPASLPWSADGHHIVCEIAFQRLKPAGRALVFTVRAHDPDPSPTFYESCVWADSSRYADHKSTYEYHFMNVVVPDADAMVMERDCASYDCVPVAVARYARYLSIDPGNSESMQVRRANALKFLGHFVGDLHQPMHVGYAHDRGGNDTAVTFFDDPERRNLHAVWDFYLPDRMGLYADAIDTAHRLGDEITPAEAAAWEGWDIVGWSRESYAVVKGLAYDLPPDRRIGEDYYARAVPVVERRMKQAGVRLAFLINEIAAGRLDLPPLFGS